MPAPAVQITDIAFTLDEEEIEKVSHSFYPQQCRGMGDLLIMLLSVTVYKSLVVLCPFIHPLHAFQSAHFGALQQTFSGSPPACLSQNYIHCVADTLQSAISP